jgi:outer membrane protein assembly factor BamB
MGSIATLASVKGLLHFVLMTGWVWSAAQLAANDWPQWRGPRRDGVCDETGLLQSWPEGGPKLLWKSGEVGGGYCAPIIVGKRIFLTGDIGEELHVFALDLDGKLVWKSKNGRAWNGSHPGARASCTFSEGRLYHLNAHGRVACLDAATGAEAWAVNILERFGGKVIQWALSECLLVDGPRVIVTPGGSKAVMAALDKTTGETVWASGPLLLGTTNLPAHERVMEPAGEADSASYASPILFPLGQRRLIVGCSLRHVFGADADTGELLWTRPIPTRYSVIATTPVRVDQALFATAPDGDGGRLYRLSNDGKIVRVETAWRTDLDCCQGGAVFAAGALFGAMYGQSKTWVKLDLATGKVSSKFKGLAKGPLLYADQRLYCVSEEGEVALLRSGSSGLESAGGFRLVPERKSDVWTHPVIANGRLYLRYHETLFCYDVRAKL